MVGSTERTSTSSESAAASDATGWAGASTDGLGPAATRPLELGAEHAVSRSRMAGIEWAWREAMVPEDKRGWPIAHKTLSDNSLQVFTIPRATFRWYLCHTFVLSPPGMLLP